MNFKDWQLKWLICIGLSVLPALIGSYEFLEGSFNEDRDATATAVSMGKLVGVFVLIPIVIIIAELIAPPLTRAAVFIATRASYAVADAFDWALSFVAEPKRSVPDPVRLVLAPPTSVITEVHGESYHRGELQLLMAKYRKSKKRLAEAMAVLNPDPHNQHDQTAVEVTIDDFGVGYLPRQQAAYVQPTLLDFLRNYKFLLTCPAELKGSKKGPDIGVFLSIDLVQIVADQDVITRGAQPAELL